MQTILVTDNTDFWQFLREKIEIIHANDYLQKPEFANGKRYHVINLCRSYGYQSLGYYVSLLAQARGHKVIPSVLTIQDITSTTLSTLISQAIDDEIQKVLHPIKSDEFILSIYFGNNMAARYEVLCRKLHGLFPLPLFRVYFKRQKEWHITRIKPLKFDEIPESHIEFVTHAANVYFNKKRFHSYRRKPKYFDLAILHNPEEKTPPSNKKALKKFIEAGEAHGLSVDLVEKSDFKILAEYDGLFIRETTSVNHHTYLFARKASSERMVVIDDPVSILKCTNKVYLAEIMQKHRIPIPKTWILTKYNLKNILNEMTFPCVLKKPDSSFSQGVIKINDKNALEELIKPYFRESDLIIAQAFMPTDFDWRIGIINNQPLYACQYFMAQGHWQIYNWQSTEEKEGMFECIPIEDVPSFVLKTAMKAAKTIGDGLYGIDIKQVDHKAYVIEVNDNPNIDCGIEDQKSGDKLYSLIMEVFLKRMRRLHGYE